MLGDTEGLIVHTVERLAVGKKDWAEMSGRKIEKTEVKRRRRKAADMSKRRREGSKSSENPSSRKR